MIIIETPIFTKQITSALKQLKKIVEEEYHGG
jgi:hypothetical protein